MIRINIGYVPPGPGSDSLNPFFRISSFFESCEKNAARAAQWFYNDCLQYNRNRMIDELRDLYRTTPEGPVRDFQEQQIRDKYNGFGYGEPFTPPYTGKSYPSPLPTDELPRPLFNQDQSGCFCCIQADLYYRDTLEECRKTGKRWNPFGPGEEWN